MEVFRAESLARAAGGEVQVLVVGRCLGIFDQVEGMEDRVIGPRHHTMSRPDDYAMFAQGKHRLDGQFRRTRQNEWQNADPLREIEDSLRLPAQEVAIEILLFLIIRKMTEIGEMQGLRVQNGMKVYFFRTHLVVMHGQVRVEF